MVAEKIQAILITRLHQDARLLARQLRFGEDILAIQDSINILGVEVDSKLSFDRHLESMVHKAFLRVTLLRRLRHLLDSEGLMKLYKAHVRTVIECSPLTWMSPPLCWTKCKSGLSIS